MNLLQNKSVYCKFIVLIVFLLLIVGAVLLATAAAADPLWQSRAAEAGVLGVFAAGVIGGLNFIVPIPPATLAPLFIASGISVPTIIFFLALGTLAADFAGYVFGRVSRATIEHKYPRIFTFVTKLSTSYRWYIVPVVALYAAFAPFPNEAILIPLALSGVKFRLLLPALLLGNIVYQTIFVYGIIGLTSG